MIIDGKVIITEAEHLELLRAGLCERCDPIQGFGPIGLPAGEQDLVTKEQALEIQRRRNLPNAR